jgi:ribosome silencing factor RsfS/YbeB/iojap
MAALEAMDAHDIKKIPIPDRRLDNIEFMIICTGRNAPHMRRMATAIVRALKVRLLRNTIGFTGAEGYDCDDWILVDCGNMLVHFMDAHTRKSIRLEAHWADPDRTMVKDSSNEKEMDNEMDNIVADNPIPHNYNVYNPDNFTLKRAAQMEAFKARQSAATALRRRSRRT